MEVIVDLAATLRRVADLLEALPAELEAATKPKIGPPLPLLFSYKEAAHYLGVSVRTLEQHAGAGEIPKTSIGRRVLFKQEDLDDYVDRLILER